MVILTDDFEHINDRINKLLDRIEVLETALKEINILYKNTFNTKNEIDWKTLAETVYQFDEIATKALWPV